MASKELERIREQLKSMNKEELLRDNSIVLVQDIKEEVTRMLHEIKSKEYKVEEKITRDILHRFKGQFTKEEVIRAYTNYSENEIIKVLKKLVKTKKIDQIGRGFYSTQLEHRMPIIRISDEIEEIKNYLTENGIIFLITGPDILREYVNLLPKRLLHLIYTAKGSGESVKELIEKKFMKTVILNPTKKEVHNLFAHYNDDIIIIREVGESSIEYHIKGIALIEKAMVDMYFEVTRKRIPFSASELAYILKSTIPRTKIDYTKLLRAASRRNVLPEFIRILDELGVNIPHHKLEEVANKNIEKILRMLR